VVLTSKDVKAHRPSKSERRQQKRAAAAAAAAAAATPAAAPPSPIAKPPAPAVGHAAPAPPTLAPPTLAPPTPVPPTPVPPAQAPPAIGVFEPNLVELGRAVEDETTPRVYRVLAALIPIVLILGMAATAVVLSRKSAFDREPAATSPTLAEAPAPAREVEPTPAPVAAPITPPLVVTPDTGEVPKVVAEPRYCLSVGTYLFSDRARARTAQLTKKTSMESWVVTGTSDGSFTYRVMLGKFASRSEAERVADKLLGRGVVSEALVESLPKNR